MKHTFLVVGALGAALTTQAQQAPTTTTLFHNYWSEVVPEEQAAYRVRRTETPGISRLDSVYRLVSPNLWTVYRTVWQPNGDTLTTTTRWRGNGKLFYVSNELGTKRHGEQLSYDAEGLPRGRSHYERGQVLSAESLTKAGTARACDEAEYTEQMPEYPGGMEAMLRYLGQSIRYPAAALKKRRQGRVFLEFVVNEVGEMRDIRVQKGVSAELDAEALRVVRAMPRWKPGLQNGEPVPVRYTVPITFAIR
ncbi:energy transducer TonB [Hymenobacter cellulosilyticus]|uniref:Energy transducer TonB n=1 Tax=Hymenobacter cellulosilyticus TaxID=2932248 RepID=A0A8T9Q555_9BACT|nr:energy transducer TonB [Hymenobacter cellulosilyticus]UOQ71038.1 energy transducer TonB [Hymenobacter cellulosilyticus]